MPEFKVTFKPNLFVTVTLDAESEDDASEQAWLEADGYLDRALAVPGYTNGGTVAAEAGMDGVGAETIEELDTEATS